MTKWCCAQESNLASRRRPVYSRSWFPDLAAKIGRPSQGIEPVRPSASRLRPKWRRGWGSNPHGAEAPDRLATGDHRQLLVGPSVKWPGALAAGSPCTGTTSGQCAPVEVVVPVGIEPTKSLASEASAFANLTTGLRSGGRVRSRTPRT